LLYLSVSVGLYLGKALDQVEHFLLLWQHCKRPRKFVQTQLRFDVYFLRKILVHYCSVNLISNNNLNEFLQIRRKMSWWTKPNYEPND